MSFPIALTLFRLLLAPIFFMFYVYYEALKIPLTGLPYALLAVLLVSELSDIFDGVIARKRNQVTRLGKILDPMADSIFRLTTFLAFTRGFVNLPLALLLVFFYRDSIISTLRTVCALQGVTLAARITGKFKAIIQGIAAAFITLLMIPYSLGHLPLATFQAISFYTVLGVAIYTGLSGLEYLYVHRKEIKQTLQL